MVINNLTLKNYGAIKDAKLEFQKGWNLISGANGQGKSHIIRAIAYLLLNKNFKKIEDDCNWDADDFLATINLVYQDIDFNIQCMFNRKNGVSKQCKIDKNEYLSPLEVNKALAEYFDPTLCSASIISFQGSMDIVSAKDAERREMLKKIYDLEFVNQIKSLEESQFVWTAKGDKILSTITLLENKRYPIKELLEYPFEESVYKDLLIKVKNIEKEILQAELVNTKFNNLMENINSFDKNRKQTQLDLDTLFSESEEIEENLNIEKNKLNSLDIANSMIGFKKELSDLKNSTEIEELQNQLKNINLKRLTAFDESGYKLLLESKSNIEHEYKTVQAKIKLIESGKCPTCARPFESSDLGEQKKELTKLEMAVKEVEDLINQSEIERERYNNEVLEQERLSSLITSIQNKIESTETLNIQKISSLEKNILNIQEKESLYKNNIQKMNENLILIKNKIDKVQEKLREIATVIYEKRKELDSMTNISIQSLTDSKNRIDQQLLSWVIVGEKNKTIEKDNAEFLEEKRIDGITLKELYIESDTIIKEIEEYNVALKIYKKDLPKYIISFLLEDLKIGMNNLLDDAYDGKYHVTTKETNSGLKILYGKKEKEISLASGSEQNLFNLGFKNAFSYLSGLQILFLDESMNFADDHVAKEVFNSLNLKIEKEEIDQIFVITHKQSIKDLLEGTFQAKVFNVSDGKVSVENI